MGVGCPCPHIRNDIVTSRHLFFSYLSSPVSMVCAESIKQLRSSFFFFVIVITRRSSAYIELVTASFRVRWYHNRKKLVLGMGRYYTMIISQCLQPCVYIYSSHDHMLSRAHRTIKGFICLFVGHTQVIKK